jgi:hypothetical protein
MSTAVMAMKLQLVTDTEIFCKKKLIHRFVMIKQCYMSTHALAKTEKMPIISYYMVVRFVVVPTSNHETLGEGRAGLGSAQLGSGLETLGARNARGGERACPAEGSEGVIHLFEPVRPVVGL